MPYPIFKCKSRVAAFINMFLIAVLAITSVVVGSLTISQIDDAGKVMPYPIFKCKSRVAAFINMFLIAVLAITSVVVGSLTISQIDDAGKGNNGGHYGGHIEKF
nr:hypothetical transcript [Hymenolepis microstoma]